MQKFLCQNYLAILKSELVVALGCTEPIAIAYAAAKARQLLGTIPERCTVHCSGNIVKNVMGVTVPNSGGLRGIDVSAILASSAETPTGSWPYWRGSPMQTASRPARCLRRASAPVS